jgi:Glycosyl hydrolases family 16
MGAVDSFAASGNPTYDSNGVSFTVAKSGDSPTLTSLFYIMFGKVSITMKTAPGAGIVSTLVLQSDDLDEIDMEWLGADGSEVQTNYFGKGDTTTYDRGAFNPAPNNQNEFITYTVEWTAQQVVWSVGGTVVRVLTPATADTNQYPQTPMQVKFGAWSGGDPSNAPGTITWARGPTNYANGPYTMVVKSIDISDYSTGTQYEYSGTSGNWQDIVAVGGKVGGSQDSTATSVVVASVPSATSSSPSIPVGGFGSSGDSLTRTGWPWVPSATTLATVAATSSIAGIPSGWTVSSSGKIVPASTAAVSELPPVSSPPITSCYLLMNNSSKHLTPPRSHQRALRLRHPCNPL